MARRRLPCQTASLAHALWGSGRSGSPEVPTLPAPGALACRTLSALLSPLLLPCSHVTRKRLAGGHRRPPCRPSLRPKLTAQGFHCASQTLHSSPVPRTDPPAQTCRLPGPGAWPPCNGLGPGPMLHPRRPSGPCGLPGSRQLGEQRRGRPRHCGVRVRGGGSLFGRAGVGVSFGSENSIALAVRAISGGRCPVASAHSSGRGRQSVSPGGLPVPPPAAVPRLPCGLV